MSDRYKIEFTEGRVDLIENLHTGELAAVTGKTLGEISGDDGHGWYCKITDKVTGLKESRWGATKSEAQEATFNALQKEMEVFEDEQVEQKKEEQQQEEEKENEEKPQVENEGGFSKRNLIVIGCLLLVGVLIIVLQKYFNSQSIHGIQSAITTNPITNTAPSNLEADDWEGGDGSIENAVPPTSTGYVQTQRGSNLRLRSQPSEQAPIIANIPNGTTVIILEYSPNFEEINGEKGKWCNIDFNGKIGWAWGGYIINNINNSLSVSGKFPQASERLLSFKELSSLSKEDLKIMRNEIFARHGYIFKTPQMKSYFATQSWYRGEYDDVTSMLSDIEKQNVELIKKHE